MASTGQGSHFVCYFYSLFLCLSLLFPNFALDWFFAPPFFPSNQLKDCCVSAAHLAPAASSPEVEVQFIRHKKERESIWIFMYVATKNAPFSCCCFFFVLFLLLFLFLFLFFAFFLFSFSSFLGDKIIFFLLGCFVLAANKSTICRVGWSEEIWSKLLVSSLPLSLPWFQIFNFNFEGLPLSVCLFFLGVVCVCVCVLMVCCLLFCAFYVLWFVHNLIGLFRCEARDKVREMSLDLNG